MNRVGSKKTKMRCDAYTYACTYIHTYIPGVVDLVAGAVLPLVHYHGGPPREALVDVERLEAELALPRHLHQVAYLFCLMVR